MKITLDLESAADLGDLTGLDVLLMPSLDKAKKDGAQVSRLKVTRVPVQRLIELINQQVEEQLLLTTPEQITWVADGVAPEELIIDE
jgi:hypothetical protein